MRLSVSHRTIYRYDTAQRHVLQSQRLQPSVFDGQVILDWRIDTSDGIVGSAFRDGAGDETRTVRVPGPVQEVVVEVEGTVETTDMAGVLRGHREKVPPMAYLAATRSTRVDVGLTELAETALDGAGDNALNRAHQLADAVNVAVAYTPGSTQAHTTAAEALAQGKGVCQDHTHVLIAVARLHNIPARYVTGYLFTDPQQPTNPDGSPAPRSDGEASHAWAELFIDGLGWVGFDAANACCPDDRYIRICSGADAADAAPIRGLASGIGAESLDVAVAVQAVQQ
jgi:transglutaminase-like putative cysteine protease